MNLDFESRFRDCIKKIDTIGGQYAQAKAQSWQLQELKGSILASIMKSLGEMPVSKAELLAKTSDDYKNHIIGTAAAIQKELELKAQYEKWKCSFEALRSLCSLEKSTQKEIGNET